MTADTGFESRNAAVYVQPDKAQLALKRVAVAALLAIVLGFVMQAAILAAKLVAGASFPGITLLVDLAQGVTWSFLVCAGVSVATAVTQGRVMLASLIAAVFAPIALALAKSAQKVMGHLIGAASEPGVLSLTTVGIFRAVEYGVLGWVLAVLVQKQEARAWPYLGIGAAVGLLVGGSFVGLSLSAASSAGAEPATAEVAAMVVNEVFFPIGCALVIFASQWVGRSLKVVLQDR
jgi:hypothetical protein